MRPRVGSHRSGTFRPGDASSRGWKVHELSFGDTSVGDTLHTSSWHKKREVAGFTQWEGCNSYFQKDKV
jgi:hypothetical protein